MMMSKFTETWDVQRLELVKNVWKTWWIPSADSWALFSGGERSFLSLIKNGRIRKHLRGTSVSRCMWQGSLSQLCYRTTGWQNSELPCSPEKSWVEVLCKVQKTKTVRSSSNTLVQVPVREMSLDSFSWFHRNTSVYRRWCATRWVQCLGPLQSPMVCLQRLRKQSLCISWWSQSQRSIQIKENATT